MGTLPEPASKAPDAGLPAVLFRLTLIGLALRLLFLALEPSTQLVGDERTWTNWAIENLVTPRVSFSPFRTHMIFYPPLYPYFIAATYAVSGSLAAVKVAQVLISALLVPAVGLVGARVFGRRTGVVGAAMVAGYPELVWFSVHFWSETLFLVFLWWAMERLFAADDDGLRPALASGFLFGLAVLTRETALYFLPIAAAWLATGRRPRSRARGAAFLVAAVLTIVPWTCRNWIAFKAFVPVSTAGGLNLWQGNARLTRQEVYDRYEAVHGRIQQYRYAQRKGLEAIWERQPTWLFEKLRDEMPRFWEADSLALIHIKRSAYGTVEPWAAVAAAVVVLVPYLAILALFVVGLAILPIDRRRLLLVAFLCFYNLLHVATHGFARYRLPVMPVVFLLAASAFLAWREKDLAPRLGPRRMALALALGVVLAVTLVPSFRLNWADPAFGLADAGGSSGDAPMP